MIANECFYGAENAEQFDLSVYDYIIVAIDTVSSKLILIERAYAAGAPVISCMGAGNKLDPTRLEVADIYKTSVCPLARVMRKELKARGIPALKVVYSREEAIKPAEDLSISCKTSCVCPPGTQRKCTVRRQVPGSVSFVPPVAGFILAGEVIQDIMAKDRQS
ncbi:tRNA threonylcarbamoyladenosine dehydratase [bioreactor metagenome]|uniref:tRNA threonylcarbamoyladenosine dehydratase n=1 Tax=bioreactor metagenome TaxID=1076179 RepID=A0A645FIS7_9ZZZZ